jgi:hypothetical protein
MAAMLKSTGNYKAYDEMARKGSGRSGIPANQSSLTGSAMWTQNHRLTID